MVKIYRNVIVPDYSKVENLPEEKNGHMYLPIKRVKFLVFNIVHGNPVGVEIQQKETEDAFWGLGGGYVDPSKVMLADISEAGSCGKIPDCSELLAYIRGQYAALFRKHCSRVYAQVSMPMYNKIVDNLMAFKVRPAVYAGGNIFFGCYTHHGSYKGAGVIVDRPHSMPSLVDVSPMYIPPPFVSKHNTSTLINGGTALVREQSLSFPWLPKPK